MSVRYIWRVRRAVPHLHVLPGDYLVYEPSCPAVWTVHHPLPAVDFGAVMGAEESGALALVEFSPSQPRVLRLVSSSPSPAVSAPDRVGTA